MGASGSASGFNGSIPGSPAGTISGSGLGSFGVLVMINHYPRSRPVARTGRDEAGMSSQATGTGAPKSSCSLLRQWERKASHVMAMRGVHERPSGLLYAAELISTEEEAELLAWCGALETEPVVMRGVASRRQVRHFGVGYDFSKWGTAPTEPIPDRLMPLRERVARLAQVETASFVEALVTHYPAGASIGWHRDATAFGPVVVGVSLGSDSVMRFQRRAAGGERRVFEQLLTRRSAYVLSGASRSAWQHSVPPVTQQRWSVTFRQLRRGHVTGKESADPA
jgi:alkylated DNA repair protein (DNA oxidative demethylase)